MGDITFTTLFLLVFLWDYITAKNEQIKSNIKSNPDSIVSHSIYNQSEHLQKTAIRKKCCRPNVGKLVYTMWFCLIVV